MLTINTMPPNGRKLTCIASTAPPASVVTVAKSEDGVIPKRTSLPSILPPACKALGPEIDIESSESRASLRFRPIDGRHTDEKQDAHHGKNRPTLALVVHHPAEHVGQPSGDPDQQQHLDEVRERSRVFIRMGGI